MAELAVTVSRPSAASGGALLKAAPPPGGPIPPTRLLRRIRVVHRISTPSSRRWAGIPISRKSSNPLPPTAIRPRASSPTTAAEYLVQDADGTTRAVAGRHLRNDGPSVPAVGDWVAVLHREPVGAIHGVVERRTVFSRKVASARPSEQVLAANVDVAFVVAAAHGRQRPAHRALSDHRVAERRGAGRAADQGRHRRFARRTRVAELEAVAMGTPVVVTSASPARASTRSRAQLSRRAPACCSARRAPASRR